MSRRDLSNNVLKLVNQKTGKKVTPGQIQKLAGSVDASTVKSEAQLRQLIKNVAGLVNVNVSEATIKEIVTAVKKSGLNPNNMEQMMNMMMGKK